MHAHLILLHQHISLLIYLDNASLLLNLKNLNGHVLMLTAIRLTLSCLRMGNGTEKKCHRMCIWLSASVFIVYYCRVSYE